MRSYIIVHIINFFDFDQKATVARHIAGLLECMMYWCSLCLGCIQ